MLITPDFVVINMPKTGSTFLRTVLTDIYRRSRPAAEFRELMLPHLEQPKRGRDQHGSVRQIPPEHASKLVVSIARNPADKVISAYEFRFWEERPPLGMRVAREMFPHFPNLTFGEYLKMAERSNATRLDGDNPLGLGPQTITFMQMYFNKPVSTVDYRSPSYFLDGAYRRDMPAIRFLRFEKLRDELAAFLAEFGFTTGELAPIFDTPKLNASKRRDDPATWQMASDFVQPREQMLYRMFADHGITWNQGVPRSARDSSG